MVYYPLMRLVSSSEVHETFLSKSQRLRGRKKNYKYFHLKIKMASIDKGNS